MLSENNLNLEFIESDELRKSIISELFENNRIISEKALKILGCQIINYLISPDNDSRLVSEIFENKKIVNKIDHINICLNKRYGIMYRNLGISKSEIINIIKQEMFFALVRFKSNTDIRNMSNNIEASFLAYVNERVMKRVISTLKKLYHSKDTNKQVDMVSSYSKAWEEEENYLEKLVLERQIKLELIKYLNGLSKLERDLIIEVVFYGTDYKTLELKYNISSELLRKKKERALKKLNKLIPAYSILRESA